MAWGFWRIPETELRILDPVVGRDVLEIGCGAARWSLALARAGARVTGLDFSESQLAHARSVTRGSTVRLVRGDAERVPFRNASFDIVFCDWGALTFADPFNTVPECARILRLHGLLAFATGSPVGSIGHDPVSDRHTRRFVRDYFGMHRLEFGDETNFQIPYGEWIGLFVRNGFSVERLHESQPLPEAQTPYLSRIEERWGRRWPLECIWKVRKTGESPPGNSADEGNRGQRGSADSLSGA
jgi:SAM-dependent methyltransferase